MVIQDTICALSSAPGRAGIAVIRISGRESAALLGKIFRPARGGDAGIPARRAVLGRILAPSRGIELDEALVTFFEGPRSYTGEDVAEISVHGSPVIVAAVLEELCSLGARTSLPGEFTMRAFLRGRIDLVQAEAVADIIEARTLYQARVAARQRSGELSRGLRRAKETLIDLVIDLESAVEFSEESEGAGTLPRAETEEKIQGIRRELGRWIDSFRYGRLVRDGFRLAVVGRPNVGKSSLFNALLREDRSIVTEIPGTTRDLVSETTDIGGIAVRLFDTAGLRDPEGTVERIGVDRSLQAIDEADAVLLVVDRSLRRSPEDESLRDRLDGTSAIIVLNKADLESSWSAEQKEDFARGVPCLEASAKTCEGIGRLREGICGELLGGSEREGALVTNLRHCRCLEEAAERLDAASRSLAGGLSEEFILADLHGALNRLGEITGETTVEDLLSGIFSRFCIGK